MMARVVITGVGCIGPVRGAVAEVSAAVEAGRPLGEIERVPLPRGRHREMRVARIVSFDRSAFLDEGARRRMEELSQLWIIACMLARSDANLTDDRYAPEERGIFLGTGFGCTGPTWEYLRGLWTDGAAGANPFLFSESVANAPGGQAAVILDARGPNVTLTCGEASAAVAVAAGARAIRHGRASLAYCGGAELMSPALVHVLAAAGAPSFLGEGSVSIVLESLDTARARAARIYGEVLGGPARVPGRRTVRALPSARNVFGAMSAAGGFDLALAASKVSALAADEAASVRARSWDGSLQALVVGALEG